MKLVPCVPVELQCMTRRAVPHQPYSFCIHCTQSWMSFIRNVVVENSSLLCVMYIEMHSWSSPTVINLPPSFKLSTMSEWPIMLMSSLYTDGWNLTQKFDHNVPINCVMYYVFYFVPTCTHLSSVKQNFFWAWFTISG